jgi:hypothetical protein
MKQLAILIILLTLGFASCKKNDITQAELIGTWAEIQPCIDSPRCYTLQFTNSGQVYVSTPFIDTGNYSVTNNAIKLDSSIIRGPSAAGSGIYQITLKGNDLTIENIYTLPADSLGPPITYNLHLMKM